MRGETKRRVEGGGDGAGNNEKEQWKLALNEPSVLKKKSYLQDVSSGNKQQKRAPVASENNLTLIANFFFFNPMAKVLI